jgi:hypothetical protein
MVHLRRGKGRGVGVTHIALRGGRDVRRRFTLGGSAIVACVASCDSQLMIECRAGFEITRGAMACFA